jgi:hypothetical protein
MMTTQVDRRLASVEAALTPTQLVCRWLDEAQTFDRYEAYGDSLLDEDPRRFPLNRLLGEAAAGVAATRRPTAQGYARAHDRALLETAFRYLLVVNAIIKADEIVRRGILLHSLIAANLALLRGRSRGPRRRRE